MTWLCRCLSFGLYLLYILVDETSQRALLISAYCGITSCHIYVSIKAELKLFKYSYMKLSLPIVHQFLTKQFWKNSQQLVHFIGRICWTLALMGMLTYMIFQIVTRINHFMEVPRSINMEVTYETAMKFPAITICNNNVLRYWKGDNCIFVFFKLYFLQTSKTLEI